MRRRFNRFPLSLGTGVPQIVTALLLLYGVLAPAASQEPALAPETTIPIRKVTFPDGGRYFALPFRAGSKELFAGIDTGSPGLRILSTSLDAKNYRPTGEKSSMTFGSGATLPGIRAMANLGFGAVKGQALVEVVEHLPCKTPGPHCIDGEVPMREMGLMNPGFPHMGAPAIIGLARGDIPVTNPFPALGVKRWIIDIPNDLGGGRLVLNPKPESLKGFVSFPAVPGPDGKLQGAIHGCLRNDKTNERICGIINFDTGAAGISVSSPDPLPKHWPPHTPASLLYQDDQGRTRLVQRFKTGDPSHSSRLFFDHRPQDKQTVIHANASPYFCFDVMYEPGKGPISLRPRASGPNDPHAAVAD